MQIQDNFFQDKTLKDKALQTLAKCLDQASAHFDFRFYYDEVSFDLRGGSAGQFVARLHPLNKLHCTLRFNNTLLNTYEQAFIDEVIPHECAHLVVFQYYGTKTNGQRVLPHGPQWKNVMRKVFSREPTVRHSFVVENKERKQYLYNCACENRDHTLSIVRHNKILRNKAKYLCKDCKANLRYKKVQ